MGINTATVLLERGFRPQGLGPASRQPLPQPEFLPAPLGGAPSRPPPPVEVDPLTCENERFRVKGGIPNTVGFLLSLRVSAPDDEMLPGGKRG